MLDLTESIHKVASKRKDSNMYHREFTFKRDGIDHRFEVDGSDEYGYSVYIYKNSEQVEDRHYQNLEEAANHALLEFGIVL